MESENIASSELPEPYTPTTRAKQEKASPRLRSNERNQFSENIPLVPAMLTMQGPADQRISSMVSNFQNQVESKLPKHSNFKIECFKPINYATQVVAGTNYFIKVQISDKNPNQCIHLKVFEDLQGNLSLENIEINKAKQDNILYF